MVSSLDHVEASALDFNNNAESNTNSRLEFVFDDDNRLFIQGKAIEEGAITLKFVKVIDDVITDTGMINAATLKDIYFPDQDYDYSSTAQDSIERLGAGDVTIDLDALAITFPPDNTDDAQIKELLSSGRFSYELNAAGQIILTFGDGSTDYPTKILTLNNNANPKITFKDTALDYPNTNDFLTAFNAYSVSTTVTNANKATTYLVAGSLDGTDDTADFSALAEDIDFNLLTGKGEIVGLHEVGAGNIENIKGGSGGDELTGDSNANTLEGGAGIDKLYGGGEDDTLIGGVGNDELYGGDGVDTLEGDAGADILEGGAGDDTLTGGVGADTYVYHYIDRVDGRKDGIDTINEVTEASVENILAIHVTDTYEWGLGKDVYFAEHTDSNGIVSPNEVRVAFDNDNDNYIVLSRDDIMNKRFLLKVYDENGAALTTGDFPADSDALKMAFDDFTDSITDQSYTYKKTGGVSDLTGRGPVTINLDDLEIRFPTDNNNDAQLKDSFLTKRILPMLILTLGRCRPSP